MGSTDDLLRNNEGYARSFDKGELPLPPARKREHIEFEPASQHR